GALFVVGRRFAAPRYRGPRSAHFDGERFYNPGDFHHAGGFDMIRWMLSRDPGEWSEWLETPPEPAPPERVGGTDLRVTFVNHATVLIQTGGLNVLTDPVWSERCSPVSWAGPVRRVAPGVPFEQLPPIDIVLISHNHYDHLDLPTLERLATKHAPLFVTGLGNRELLERNGISPVEELDWWETTDRGSGVRIHAVPAQHFSSRGFGDRDATLWCGFVLETGSGLVYFAGDTGFGPHFEEIRRRFGSPRLALLPIGAFRPEWFMSQVHLSPDDALRAHDTLRASTSVAIHFGTFHLGDDGQLEPAERLQALLQRKWISRPRFWVLGFGEGRAVPS
ncbi:MAG: MBL fold metallo-hydrolase, partial [Thermoanaerobaculia bacterium]